MKFLNIHLLIFLYVYHFIVFIILENKSTTTTTTNLISFLHQNTRKYVTKLNQNFKLILNYSYSTIKLIFFTFSMFHCSLHDLCLEVLIVNGNVKHTGNKYKILRQGISLHFNLFYVKVIII